MFDTILFPLDRSREAQEAIAVAIDLVQKYHSKLILLSVVETPDLDAEVLEDPVMQSPDAIDRLLHSARDSVAKHGIVAEILQREGKPAFTICDVADELNVNLIVMGSRGIGLDLEHTAESVASRVINLSPCPVLIVP
ncbi:universal stress protein [Chamaesiphon sp. GL140_3_metabinner_50]|uniref:universal stress protein n=1 Tax=Chamaesiphon sp. GL140_3_metabinner_50 TaxID=2970812 RepID=UPI0025D8018C|nr:universal stress protein [Chamaesiphon sp. GL140_3_metabinner_50]